MQSAITRMAPKVELKFNAEAGILGSPGDLLQRNLSRNPDS